MLGLCFAVLCVISSFAIISLGKIEVVALVLLCGCYWSFTLPRGAMGWSLVCDSGISWSVKAKNIIQQTFFVFCCGVSMLYLYLI